jgi:hypothetical protein
MEVIGKGLPDLPVLDRARSSIAPRNAQHFQGNALRVEHAEDIVIGNDERVGGWAKGDVLVGQQPGIDVTVWTDNGQVCDASV